MKLFRFAPIHGSEAEDYFERMAYIEERFYESVLSKQNIAKLDSEFLRP